MYSFYCSLSSFFSLYLRFQFVQKVSELFELINRSLLGLLCLILFAQYLFPPLLLLGTDWKGRNDFFAPNISPSYRVFVYIPLKEKEVTECVGTTSILSIALKNRLS